MDIFNINLWKFTILETPQVQLLVQSSKAKYLVRNADCNFKWANYCMGSSRHLLEHE